MDGFEIILKDLLERVKTNSEKNAEQAKDISELKKDVCEIKQKINDDTIYKSKLYDNIQGVFSKKIFWLVVIATITLVGFGISGLFTNTDNIVKITKTIKGE